MWGILQPHKHNFGVGVDAHGPYGLVIPELFLHFFLMRGGVKDVGRNCIYLSFYPLLLLK